MIDSNILSLSSSFPINQVLSLIVLGALPIIFMTTTSYLKVSVVLSVLRSALGGGQIPSQSLSGILALLISLFTISPVIENMLTRYDSENSKNPKSSLIKKTELTIVSKVTFVFEPLIEFMRLNTQLKERLYFYRLDRKRTLGDKFSDIECSNTDIDQLKQCLKMNESISSLVISYVSSELRTACTLGVYIFVPFLVIDLVISTLLTGLGMMMVSPVTITLPLKLLVFIMSDGWRLLIENLVNNYKLPFIG